MGHLLRLLWKRWHFELDRGLRDTEDPLSIIVSESLGIDKEAGPETAGHRRQSTHVNLRAMTRRESIVDAVKLFTATVSTQDLHPQVQNLIRGHQLTSHQLISHPLLNHPMLCSIEQPSNGRVGGRLEGPIERPKWP